MEAAIRRLLAMAARVLDFVKAQPASTDPGYQALVSALQELVARGDEVALQQQEGATAQAVAVRQRAELRRRMIRDQVRYLVRVAQRAAKSNPGFAGQFRMPRGGGPLKDFITSVKALLAAAEPEKDLLVSLGLGGTFLDDLTASISSFDDATGQAHAGQRGHVSARAELVAIGKEIVEVTNALDGWFRVQFTNDPQSLAAWEVARNVVGPFRRPQGNAAPEPTPDPVPGPSPAPEPGPDDPTPSA